MFVMDRKKYNQLRAAVALFVSTIVALAVVRNSYLLSIAGVLTGMVFMVLVRSKAKIKIDEREATIQEKAARMTYAIFAPTIGIGAFLLLTFSRKGFAYLESLGMIFAYLTLFLIALYAISYHFFNRQFGGGGNEE
jgi:uncharacterized membrane protein